MHHLIGSGKQIALSASSPKAKIRFLNSCIGSIPAFRWSRWAYQQTYASKLDSTQRRMTSILFNIRPQAGENYDDFAMRRRSTSRRLIGGSRWSRMWAQSIRNWYDHVVRNHDQATWSAPLLEWHDQQWLYQQRLVSSRFGESRTNTRATRGKVQMRWADGLDKAICLPDPIR